MSWDTELTGVHEAVVRVENVIFGPPSSSTWLSVLLSLCVVCGVWCRAELKHVLPTRAIPEEKAEQFLALRDAMNRFAGQHAEWEDAPDLGVDALGA